MSLSSNNGKNVSPLRQRMIEDMRMRKLAPKTQAAYIRSESGDRHGSDPDVDPLSNTPVRRSAL